MLVEASPTDLVVVKQKLGWELQYGSRTQHIWPDTARTIDRLLLQPGYPVHVYVLVQAIYEGGMITACDWKGYVWRQIYLARKALAAVNYPGEIRFQTKRGYYLDAVELPSKKNTCFPAPKRVISSIGGS